MTKKALLIGINYIGTSHELHGCINDIKNMKKYLKRTYRIDHLKTMDDTKSGTLKPTKKNIIRQLKWLVKDAKCGDNLYLHYSGHGTNVYDSDGSEADGKDECICPLGGDVITDDDLHVIIKKLPHNVKLVCVFDCCHSGTMLDLRYQYYRSNTGILSRLFLRPKHKILINRFHYNTDANIIVLSGCKDYQTSADATINNMKQGAMTYALLRTLKVNNKINVINCVNEMNYLLHRKGYSQRPQLTWGKKINLRENFELL